MPRTLALLAGFLLVGMRAVCLPGQDPIEVVGNTRNPGPAVAGHPGHYVLFDTCFAVFVAASDLRFAFCNLEQARRRFLRELADDAATAMADDSDPDAKAVAGAARVVAALLGKSNGGVALPASAGAGDPLAALCASRTITLSLRGVPTTTYTLHVVHESGAVVDAKGKASGEHTLDLPPGPCTLHVLRADGSEFAQRVFTVGEAAPQIVELDLRGR